MPQDPKPTPPCGSKGRVLFLGSGPGDPELFTLRGKRLLATADVVLYDYLASEALLQYAPPHAETISLGRHGQGKLWTQEEICQRIVAEALAGKTVARLKGGDPGVFGRLAEELAACRAAGLECEIVPGVTSALAAGAYAGFPLTDRRFASSVTLVTGHDCSSKDAQSGVDFARLASTPGTLVVYMGVTTAPEWSRRLIEGGKPVDTPVLVVRRCSLPDQRTIACTLGEVAGVLAPGKVRPPLVVVIGDAARDEGRIDWFAARPLHGKTVLVTRPREQSAAMAKRLTDLGARVLLQPTIEIAEPDDRASLDAAIKRSNEFDLIAFSSSNGVEWFMQRLFELGHDTRKLGGVRLATIGPATAGALNRWRLKADVQPSEYRAEALAEALAGEAHGKSVLLVRASRGREVLAESLRDAGAQVEQVVAYTSRDLEEADPGVLAELHGGLVDWVTATSSAIARSIARLFGPKTSWPGSRVAAISPLTAEALAEVGCEADAVATEYTTDGVIDAILKAERGAVS